MNKVWKAYSDNQRWLLRSKAAAKSVEVSIHNTGSMYYGGCLLFIASSTCSFTTLEVGVRSKCCICLVTELCTKINFIWYLHFCGIRLEFMGVYIQNTLVLDSGFLGWYPKLFYYKKKKKKKLLVSQMLWMFLWLLLWCMCNLSTAASLHVSMKCKIATSHRLLFLK